MKALAAFARKNHVIVICMHYFIALNSFSKIVLYVHNHSRFAMYDTYRAALGGL